MQRVQYFLHREHTVWGPGISPGDRGQGKKERKWLLFPWCYLTRILKISTPSNSFPYTEQSKESIDDSWKKKMRLLISREMLTLNGSMRPLKMATNPPECHSFRKRTITLIRSQRVLDPSKGAELIMNVICNTRLKSCRQSLCTDLCPWPEF